MHPKALPWIALLSPTVTALNIPLPFGPSQQVLNPWSDEICPLAPKISPSEDGLHPALRFVEDDSIRAQQANRLSRAVQVPTTVTDYLTDPYDEGFAPFVEFQDLLKELFPLVHKKATLSHINRLGLVYTLPGRDPTLKPILFTAHQDVVPINDASDWTHPPFEGYYDGTWLWGRGASDCKNVLIGLLSVVEDLVSQDWTPNRTVLLAFGFDEESHGFLGAGAIAEYLEGVYGKDGVEFVLDEGGMGLETLSSLSSDTNGEKEDDDGVVYALPGVSEKGSVDLVLTLSVPGGHSSVPPAHTGIGILSEIIYTLENNELFTPRLDDAHPSRKKLECQVRHSPSSVEPWLADALQSSDHVSTAEKLARSRGAQFRYILQTSQAADLFHGGVKTNALPEHVEAVVNYRVALHQTPEEVMDRAVRLIAPIVERLNLTLAAFPEDKQGEEGKVNHLTISTLSKVLSPAPVSPTGTGVDAVWTRFAGVTRSVFESVPSLKGKTVVVSGDIMTGNTDTRFYWNLSRNIYRWSPSRAGGALNIHTVDERLAIDVHLEAMALYYDLIRAFDAWESSVESTYDL
ncbi:putative vacuolar carboxypeptidase Cps1 [Aspergillus nomiae NRRL 13137]|uniref:Putative vacuolar carboxypeptidase Cps1 n=1 Tax=Aspergillus nomiae NRRL (strain ATCC 15546 / NRRL 13137 / CBS 260.88 / M93) TaxID=1509407 RepID=A0A0L1JE65_ASPN3|nr:putative vacuolar carboxypeptidase Cps1 [Aspergillus nomiae NRRL 13137]KNG90094.1 putative vacuolar carboxypeptidase Cps1 [Aspergillus nomiae NRRL 13137]